MTSPLQTTAVTAPTSTSTSASSVASALSGGGSVNKNEFLQIMVAELTHQDPEQPADPTQFVSELAQFSSLEQETNLNTTATSQLSAGQLSAGVEMIGHTVTYTPTATTSDPNPASATGTVSDVAQDPSSGNVTVNVDGVSVGLSQITNVA